VQTRGEQFITKRVQRILIGALERAAIKHPSSRDRALAPASLKNPEANSKMVFEGGTHCAALRFFAKTTPSD
jgi:hypothetical protein